MLGDELFVCRSPSELQTWLRRLLMIGCITVCAACAPAQDPATGHNDESNPSQLEKIHAPDVRAQTAVGGATASASEIISAAKAYYEAAGPYGFVVEKNVGEAFRNTHVDVAADAARCATFAKRAPVETTDPLIVAVLTTLLTGDTDADRQLYTVFRPQRMVDGEKYSVIAWGNGTCGTPLHYHQLLSHLASHGFIVVGANAGFVGSGVEMRRALDFVIAENKNPRSALFGKVDVKNLGVSGHSQGGSAAIVVAGDDRVLTSVPIQGVRAEKVRDLKGSTFLIAGERDTMVKPEVVERAFSAAYVPVMFGLSLGQDHGMPVERPGAIRAAVAAWFHLHLASNEKARGIFYGNECGICTDPAWRIKRRNF